LILECSVPRFVEVVDQVSDAHLFPAHVRGNRIAILEMAPQYHHVPTPPTGEDRGPMLNRVSIAVYIVAVAVVALR
jgi:hypothetical protein